MAFTEFYCNASTGSQINAGDLAASGIVTDVGGTYAQGGGAGGTDRYTVSSGTPFSAAVAGQFASIYTAGATVTTFVGRITAVNGGGASLDISLSAIAGTRPANGSTKTCTIGGAWLGPNAADSFPFGFTSLSTLKDAGGDVPRINFKNGTTYSITAAMTHSITGSVCFQGYSTVAGDGGKATIDGGTSGASYTLLTVSGSSNWLVDLIFQNNGASGSGTGFALTGGSCLMCRCVINNVQGIGVNVSNNSLVLECEAYACNKSNTANAAAFSSGASGSVFVRCIAHDNSGSNTQGFRFTGTQTAISCISDTNGSIGFFLSSSLVSLSGCDSYNNGSDGIRLSNGSAATMYIENCNAIKNTGWGINGSGAGVRVGFIMNCGFGSGTQANGSGTITGITTMVTGGSITYPTDLTPWVDPGNGDFRITLAAAINSGRGAFTETASSYAGTIGYPCVGAAAVLLSLSSASDPLANAVPGAYAAGTAGYVLGTYLTAVVAPASTALSTAQWTNTLATNLGTLAGHDPGATLASQTNITGGTITTVTNLTNAPAAGDFTATMKTSLNAATPASVVGAVGSVTGNVGGNVVGTVASVVGNVGGNVTGSVGSVAGNIGGDVTGKVLGGGASAFTAVGVQADLQTWLGVAPLALSSQLVQATGSFTLDMTEAVPINGAPNSLADCLNAARVQGLGDLALDLTAMTLTLKNYDGTTAKVFNLTEIPGVGGYSARTGV